MVPSPYLEVFYGCIPSPHTGCTPHNYSRRTQTTRLLPERARGDRMRRREFIILMASATTVWPLAVLAQEGGKVFRVGSLSAGAPIPELVAITRKALQELGWI